MKRCIRPERRIHYPLGMLPECLNGGDPLAQPGHYFIRSYLDNRRGGVYVRQGMAVVGQRGGQEEVVPLCRLGDACHYLLDEGLQYLLTYTPGSGYTLCGHDVPSDASTGVAQDLAHCDLSLTPCLSSVVNGHHVSRGQGHLLSALPSAPIVHARELRVLPNRHEGDPIVENVRFPRVHLPEETRACPWGHEALLPYGVLCTFQSSCQTLGVGKACPSKCAVRLKNLHQFLP